MRETGAAATCTPIRLDGGAWESAIFVHLTGRECAHDRLFLGRANGSVPVGVEADLLQHENGTVVILRLEIHARPEDPMAVEILILPGGTQGHYETLRLLSEQPRLCWFFADEKFRVIHAQQYPLSADQQHGFHELVLDAVKHDALVRCTGRYDSKATLASVLAHYGLRKGKR